MDVPGHDSCYPPIHLGRVSKGISKGNILFWVYEGVCVVVKLTENWNLCGISHSFCHSSVCQSGEAV